MRTPLLIASLLLVAAPSPPTDSSCADRTRLDDFGRPGQKKAIYLAQDALFFRTPNIELDIDGSPRAYGARDQGIEDICNGLAPLEPIACKGKVQGPCYAACQASFRRWNGNPDRLGDVMCSVGLGGGNCSRPRVRLQSAPRVDWFVSETSVHPAAGPGISLGAWLARQDGQLDSEAIPYFVIPGGFRRLPWDATPGDAGVIVAPDGAKAFFLIGDTGGNLDEASAAVLAALRGVDHLATRQKSNAFGVSTARLSGSLEGDYSVAIFRHTSRKAPGDPSVLTLAAAEIPGWVRATVEAKLASVGGVERVRACSR
jgi:hypothetical protein